MYLSIIPYDLLIVEVAAFGFKETALKQIYPYLKNYRQCVRLNNAFNNVFNPIQNGPFRGCSRMIGGGGVAKAPPSPS